MGLLESRTCTKCGAVKPLVGGFQRDAHKPTGFDTRCAECVSARRRERYKENPDAIRAAKHRLYLRHHERELEKHRAMERKRDRREYHTEYARTYARDPEKLRARLRVTDAVYRGVLVKPDRCEQCGKETPKARLQGHHEDYSKPLEVSWLCAKCHGAHRRIEPVTRGTSDDR